MSSIYDSYDGEYLLKKIKEYDKLLWFMAKRFSIPGVLLPDDLYQEGLLALDESLEEDWNHHPDSAEFERSFKSRLGHRLSHCLRWYKQSCRDWRKELRDVIRDFDDDDESSLLDKIPQDTHLSPEEYCETKDLYRFLLELRSLLEEEDLERGSVWGSSADDALELLDIIMNPVIPESVCQLYERVPGHLSYTLLAEITGWDIMKVRRGMKKLRKFAAKLTPKYGIDVRY